MLDIDQIYCGDSLELIKKIDSNSVDLAVTSPKYNLGIKYDSCDDFVPWDEYYDWCRSWMKEVYRVLKPDGRFCLNHYISCGMAKHRSAPLMNLNAICEFEIGFKHHGFVLWDDRTISKRTAWGSWMSASAVYVNSPHEGITILYKDHWKKDTKGESTITKEEFMEATTGIWKLSPEKHRGGCPAPFPVSLPKRCINLLTYKGDLVLDLFNGGGTTCIAAKQTGRHYIGMDMSRSYCDDAIEWLNTGIRPARTSPKKKEKLPILNRDPGVKRDADFTPTKYCGCGAIIDREVTMCPICSHNEKLEKISDDYKLRKNVTLEEICK
jgi:site-specific DNA-methyltransferase (adenine-specific)